MKRTILSAICLASVITLASCNTQTEKETPLVAAANKTVKPDLSQIRSEIQAVENEWAAAQNTRDLTKLMALYADDAVTMPEGKPMISGKAAIQAQQEKDFAAPSKYASLQFETLDVYSQGDVVTEVGKTTYKDAGGNAIGGGKYIAVFEKRDGKWLCIREIYNSDAK